MINGHLSLSPWPLIWWENNNPWLCGNLLSCFVSSVILCMSITITGKCQRASCDCSSAVAGDPDEKLHQNKMFIVRLKKDNFGLTAFALRCLLCVFCSGGSLDRGYWMSSREDVEEQAVLTSAAASVDVISGAPLPLTLSPSSGCWSDPCHRLTHYSSSFCTLTCAASVFPLPPPRRLCLFVC